jgi:hypothetical protein
VPNDVLDKIPQALKSLYQLENELRSALLDGVILRKDEARQHLSEARRHLEDLLNSARKETVNPPNPTANDVAAPKKEGDI